jgi:hypothetical protein
VLKKAFDELLLYLERKDREEKTLMEFRLPFLNEKQARMILLPCLPPENWNPVSTLR